MAYKKAPKKIAAGGPLGAGNKSSRHGEASLEARGAGRESDLTEVDREVIDALTDFRDALRDRAPLAAKYTVRQVVVVMPPPQFGPDDVRKAREMLGVSQPVFADFLGTSPSTVRSWEQGQKPPSPMARRLLGLIESDPSYWKSRFLAMVQPRESEHERSVVAAAPPGPSGGRPNDLNARRRDGATARKRVKQKGGPS